MREVDLPAPLGVAVSGGPDSLALLLLAAARHPGQVRAATVDHGLRRGSAEEAAAVAEICRARGIPHDILTVSVRGSLQAAARAARYRALADWAVANRLPFLATAHHADDQAETLLMRLARGAGVGGLAGARRQRPLAPGVTLVRPLLGHRKAELEALVAAAGLTPVHDPSNRDPRFDRTAARQLLAATPALDPARLARSAANLAEAEEALAWTVDRLATERIAGDALDPAGLPPELVRRLVARLFAAHGATPSGPELSRLIACLEAGQAATLAGLKALPGPRWRFVPAPPRRRPSDRGARAIVP